MLVAAYDDRSIMPDYFAPFIVNSALFCELNLISPAKKFPRSSLPGSGALQKMFKQINPATLPGYIEAQRLFDDIFINYSTNPFHYERTCFYRWFALNALTHSMDKNEYICLLDTDFMIGITPSAILSMCLARSAKQIQFIAEWDDSEYNHIGPEITIMTKAYLYGFCEYLLTTYFSQGMRGQIVKEYFERIGNGLPGGICDMRALCAYSKLNSENIYNLRSLGEPLIIGNFNSWLASEVGESGYWKIHFQSDRQTLQIGNQVKRLVGTHFQGDAKRFMTLACRASGKDKEVTRSIVKNHLESLRIREKASQTLLRRSARALKSAIRRIVD